MIPDSIKKHRPTGTEVRYLNHRYYVYKISSVYDKEKKRAKKVTGPCIGQITEEKGFIPSKEKVDLTRLSVKEYGAYHLISSLTGSLLDSLQEHFPIEYRRIYSIAFLRMIYGCSFQRLANEYLHSYLSEMMPNIALSKNTLTSFLDDLGKQRHRMVSFMKKYVSEATHVIFDGTDFLTDSKKSGLSKKGYNSQNTHDKQISLLYAFSSDAQLPVYYRILPGNIPDMSSFSLAIQESGINKAIIVADKGFFSTKNVEYLDKCSLHYIIPLKLNNKLIDKTILKTRDKSKFDGYFMYHRRSIWYYKITLPGNKYIYVFQDDDYRRKSENEYLERMENHYEGYTMEEYLSFYDNFGVIAMYSNLDLSGKEIYQLYKGRWEIEVSFNYLKNTLDLDRVSMQSSQSIEAWAFLNHISLMMFYGLYKRMKEEELLDKYSVKDILQEVKHVNMIKINDKWHCTERTKKENELFDVLGAHIT